MKKSLSILLLFLVPALFFCQKKENKDSISRVINLAIGSNVRSLDPRISSEGPSYHIINMLYEGLMRLGPNGEILPGAAESVTVSEDKRTYTFHLRDSVWSNGDPVTAHDFEYAWKKSVNPLSAKSGAFTFYAIKNASACLEKEVSVDEFGVRALDDKTLEVKLENPAPYFLSLCACSTYSPIHKKFDLEYPQWANSKNEHLVGNGPFMLKDWRKGVEIRVEKNPLYWDVEKVQIPEICIQVVESPNTQILLFEKGELDWVGDPFGSLPIDIVSDYWKRGKLEFADACMVSWYFLNTEKPPFNNKNFRKAIAYAINRKAIAEHVFQLDESPAMGILNGEIAVQDKPYFEDGNVALAQEHFKKALEEMKMTVDELPPIILSQRAEPLSSRANQAVQQQLWEALKIKVEVHQADWPVIFNQIAKGDYEFVSVGWHSWLKDPIYTLNAFRDRSSAINVCRWEHPKYQEALRKSDCEIDIEKRKEYLRQAEELLMEEMPVIPLCFNKLYYLKNSKLKGVYISSLRVIDFRYAYFSDEPLDEVEK